MVEGCTATASEFLRHKYEMGGGWARASFRNDVFICERHLAPIKKYRFWDSLAKVSLLVWMGCGLLGLFALGVSGETVFQFRSLWYVLLVIPCVALFSYAKRLELPKKKEYNMIDTSEDGTRWADDSFSAPVSLR